MRAPDSLAAVVLFFVTGCASAVTPNTDGAVVRSDAADVLTVDVVPFMDVAPATDVPSVDVTPAADVPPVDVTPATDVPPPPPPSDAGATCYPPCFLDPVQNCIPMGNCVAEGSPSDPNGLNQCYDNGVRELITSSPTDPNGAHVVFSRAGALCFAVDLSVTSSGQQSATYYDASGNTFASELGDSGPIVTITCGGATYTVDTTSPACAAYMGSNAQCSSGMCP